MPENAVNEPPPTARRRPLWRAMVVAMRPRQWTKNAFVFAALVLTQQLGCRPKLVSTLITFLSFCAVSSAVYLINDLADIENDRRHPEKRRRPLASGDLGARTAIGMALALAAGGVGATLALAGGAFPEGVGAVRPSPLVAVALIGYLGLQLAYTFVLKHWVIIDVLAIAGGFVLRVLAGGAAIDTPISPYLYVSMINLALFQGFAKRRHELHVLAESAGGHRRSLQDYTVPLLDQFILLAASVTVVTYCLYAITTPARPKGVSANLILLTVPFVIYAILRYLYLVQARGMGGAPEDILLRDRPLLLSVAGWIAAFVTILYVVPRLTGEIGTAGARDVCRAAQPADAAHTP
ncbi:MAG: decaprenyl-phosphate phosphoribosyltransferase [Anaerolineae bacterium]